MDDLASAAGAEKSPACLLVIFGAAGDLTRRLLFPALYNLVANNLVDAGFAVIGVDHNARTDEDYRAQITQSMSEFAATKGGELKNGVDARAWSFLRERIFYLTADFEDPQAFAKLTAMLSERGAKGLAQNAIFYLATSDRFFGPIADGMAQAGLASEASGFRRLIIEKPFGHDLASAKELNARLLANFAESQIYRIDHFLGKETVQNIMALRFANGLFEPLWNRNYIDHVQITAAETVGVGTRGKFYDATGALRDMTPNHLCQLLAMVAMEAPNSFNADAVRNDTAKIIEAVRKFTPDDVEASVVRGQYEAGSIDGTAVEGYTDAKNVAAGSVTETFVAMRVFIDNWRWAGVPFYLRTGKAMSHRQTEIVVRFKPAPFRLFANVPAESENPNTMVIRVQPNEGITLGFDAKIPGQKLALARVRMEFRYDDYFQRMPSTGYETLLYDCLIGDATLFQRADNIEAGWAVVQPLLDAWANGLDPLHMYEAGTSGPAAADELLARDGRAWRPLGRDRG